MSIGQQFSQYVVVGGLAFFVDFTTIYLLTHFLGLHYLVGSTTGFMLGLALNYALCVLWIFDSHTLENRVYEFAVFAAIGASGLFLNNFMIWMLTEYVGLFYLASKVLAAGFILVFNFALRRQILFVRRESSIGASVTLPVSAT